jgi:hypothetical protein
MGSSMMGHPRPAEGNGVIVRAVDQGNRTLVLVDEEAKGVSKEIKNLSYGSGIVVSRAAKEYHVISIKRHLGDVTSRVELLEDAKGCSASDQAA